MTLKFTPAQMSDAEARIAEAQLETAARELSATTKGDWTEKEIRSALDTVVAYATPLGIKRMKWLKILTLWHLYPEAAPVADALTALLAQTARPQDDRMRAALELPLPPAARP